MIARAQVRLIDAAVAAANAEEERKFSQQRRRLRRLIRQRLGKQFVAMMQWQEDEATIEGIRFRARRATGYAYAFETYFHLEAMLNGHTDWQQCSDLPGLGRLIIERHEEQAIDAAPNPLSNRLRTASVNPSHERR
jgi:predicted N-acetyltransferase YhbS